MLFFFFCELRLITVLLLICDSHISWSTRFVSLKLCVGFSIFNFISFLLKFILLFNKMHGFFDFKRSQFLYNFFFSNNRKATHGFAPRPLIFKLQQEVLKLKDICMSWSFPKADLETKFFDLEKYKFWERQFFSIVTLSKYLTFLYWLIYLFF